MPQLTPEEIKENRKNAAARLAAGSAMIGGAAVAHHGIKERTGVKGPIHALKDINRAGVRPKHGKYAAGWLGTRAVTAAGLPLAVSGASNLLAKRPKTEEGVDVRRDVIGGTVNAATPGTPVKPVRPTKRTLKEQASSAAPIVGGAALGGLAGRKAASRIGRTKGSKARIAAMGVGAGLGSAFGASAAIPVTRHAVDVASSGRYRYSPKRGVVKKSQPGAIVELPKTEQQQLIRQKKKQSKYSLASAGLGLTAFGLKSPALVASAAKRSKRLSAMKPVRTFAGHAPATDKAATNLGIAALGVGGMGSLNFARIQRAETKADQKAIRKDARAQSLMTGDWNNMSDDDFHHLVRHLSSHGDYQGPAKGPLKPVKQVKPKRTYAQRRNAGRVQKSGVRLSTIRDGAGEGLERDHNYVEAHHKGKNIGYLKMRGDRDSDKGRIRHVYVSPRHRRKGIATSMYRRAEDEGFEPKHHDVLSDEGRAWKRSMTWKEPLSKDDESEASVNYRFRRDMKEARALGRSRNGRVIQTPRWKSSGMRPPRMERPVEVRAIRDQEWAKRPPKRKQHNMDLAKALVSKRVLVTGSRDWDDEPAVHAQLDRLHAEHPDIEVIEGGAKGADTHARNWAKARGKKVSTYQADWKAHGRSAGPRRNQRMIDEGKPERVLAFSRDLENSKGTRDMVRRAKRANVPTEVYGSELAKALFPTKLFRPKPIGFGGIRAGGIRRTVTGRLVPYRGSVG